MGLLNLDWENHNAAATAGKHGVELNKSKNLFDSFVPLGRNRRDIARKKRIANCSYLAEARRDLADY
jgi:hypothetical protein